MTTQVRQSSENACILEVSYDSGATWENFADLSLCVEGMFPPDNNPPARGQPGENTGGPTPGLGFCYDYDLSLQANGYTIIPLDIQAGDTITVSDVRGATHEGNIYQDWYCGDGNLFVLGVCIPNSGAGVETDPVPELNHHTLLLHEPDNSYVDAGHGLTVVVGDGVTSGPWTFQVNDSDLTDNSGDLSFHVRVCRAAVGITYVSGGSGPSFCEYGDTIEVTGGPSTVYGGSYDFAMAFSQCVHVEVLSLDGWTARPTGGSTAWRDCDHNLYAQTDGTPILVDHNSIDGGYGSATPITCTMRITEAV